MISERGGEGGGGGGGGGEGVAHKVCVHAGRFSPLKKFGVGGWGS